MPIGTPEGFLDITNATLRTSVVGISNTGPTGELSVGSNLHVDTTASNVLQVVGNVSSHNMTLGEISLVPAHGLENVTEVGNTTPHTVSFSNATTGLATTSNLHVGGSLKVGVIDFFNPGLTLATVTNNSNVTPYTVDLRNATTGLVTTSNVVVGKDLQVAGNVSLTGSVTSNLHLASNLEVGTANLFVNPATSNVGIGTNAPLAALDVRGNLRLTSTSNAAHFAELSAGQTSNAYVKITDISGQTIGADDRFGSAIAISGDGSTLAVSAPRDDDAGGDDGALYIFKKNLLGQWYQHQKNTEVTGLDYLGHYSAIAMSRDGSTIVAGSYLTNPGGIGDAGAAYIYKLVGGSYVYQQEISASDKAVSDHFGRSVAISSDGTTIIVGSNQDDDGASTQGSAYIFDWNGSTWSQTQKIVQSDTLANSEFGFSVSMSDDGTVAAVSAAYHDNPGGTAVTNGGAVYIFTKSGGTWSQTQKMYASDYTTQANQSLGYNISMAGDGSMVVAGALYNDTTANDSGAAYVFVKSGGVWPVTETQILKTSDAATSDTGGWSVSTSQNGDRIIYGAPYDDDNQSNSGSIYIFDRSNGTWTQTKKYANHATSGANYFGKATAVSSDGMVYVGGTEEADPSGTNSGDIRIFEDEVWRERSNTFTVNAGILSKNPVMFKVRLDDSHVAATQIIKWNKITLNIGGGYDDTTGLFTAPISGFYHLSFWGMTASSAAYAAVEWRKNGLPYPGPSGVDGRLHQDPQYTEYPLFSASNIIDLEAGDTAALWIVGSSFHTDYNGFSGFYISS